MLIYCAILMIIYVFMCKSLSNKLQSIIEISIYKDDGHQSEICFLFDCKNMFNLKTKSVQYKVDIFLKKFDF